MFKDILFYEALVDRQLERTAIMLITPLRSGMC